MKSVRKNAFYGFLGFAIPTVVVFVAYPILVHHLGKELFGIFVLATSFSGVLAFLDFGLSAATTKFVAEDMGNDNPKSAGEVIVISLIFYGILGGFLALTIWLFSPWLISLFSIQTKYHVDAVWAFRLASIQIAATMLMTVFVSQFKGLQRFDLASLVLGILSVMTYGGLIAGVLIGGVGLVGATAISMAASIVVLVVTGMIAIHTARSRSIKFCLPASLLAGFRRMFGFCSVMAINSISGIFLYQIQRYLIGGLIGPAGVTVYQLATTVPSKAHSVVNAITEIMFPLASGEKNREKLRRVYLKMILGSASIALMVLVPLSIFANPVMTLWVGKELAEQAAPLIPIFSMAFFVLALSPAPYHVVNGMGKPLLNTISYASNAALNLIVIGVFALNGITLAEFAWAFAIANIINGVLYQIAVEILIWRNDDVWQSIISTTAVEHR